MCGVVCVVSFVWNSALYDTCDVVLWYPVCSMVCSMMCVDQCMYDTCGVLWSSPWLCSQHPKENAALLSEGCGLSPGP